MSDNTNIYPLSGWKIGPIKGVIAFQPHYILSDISPDEMRTEDRFFGLTLPQAHELIEALQKAINEMEQGTNSMPEKDLN